MKKIYKSFMIVLIVTILSKIASFISEIVIAYILGTTQKADAYSIIIGVHQVIYPMLNVGIWSIFLPTYKKIITKGNNEKANCLINKIVSLFTTISIIVVIIINIFSKQIISLIANGFNAELQKMCVELLRIYSPYFIFVIISSIYAAVLQSHDKFFGSQIREVATYLPTIFLGPWLYKLYDVRGLIIALLIGSILRLIVLLPFISWDYKFKLDLKFKNDDIKSMIKKMPSVLITTGVEQVNLLIDKIMASYLSVGAVSSLSYGNKLINAFNGLFTSAISTTVYPTMSKLIAEDRKKEFKELIEKIIIITAIIIIPLSFLMLLLRKEIVSLVFERGEFNTESVSLTATVFAGYLIGMYYIGTKTLINNAFYSIGNTKIIMNISIITIIINVILNLVLMKFFEITGLAIATSISSILYFMLAIYKLYKMDYLNMQNVVKKLVKIYAIALTTYILTYLLKKLIGNANNLILIMIIGIVFVMICILQLKKLKVKEYEDIFNLMNEKIRRKSENGSKRNSV